MLWFFSDEKNFCQDQVHNRQNHQRIAMCRNDVPRVMKTKFPNTVMVFGVINSDGDVMQLQIFKTALWVDTEIYLQVMETVVLPWIKQVAWDRPWLWQQDSAPCHVSKCSLICYNFVTKEKLPSSSLDLNPMDYFFWGVLKNQTNQHPHTTKASLITSIKEQCISIDREMVKKLAGSSGPGLSTSSRLRATMSSRMCFLHHILILFFI